MTENESTGVEGRGAAARARLAKLLHSKPTVRQRIRLDLERSRPRPAPHLLGHWPRAKERRWKARTAATRSRMARFFAELDAGRD